MFVNNSKMNRDIIRAVFEEDKNSFEFGKDGEGELPSDTDDTALR